MSINIAKAVFVLCMTCFFPTPIFCSSNFHLVTVATRDDPGLDILKISAEYYGHALKILGRNKSWISYGTKFVVLNEYVNSLPDEDIILFVDAYDVVILGSSEDFLREYRKFDKKIVCSSETNLWPISLNKYLTVYPSSFTRFRFLNSGSFMCKAQYLKQMFNFMGIKRSSGNFDDQEYMNIYFLKNQDLFHLDNKVELFLTLHLVNPEDLKFDVVHKKIFLKETNTTPLLFHGNGSGKLWYQDLYKLLFLGKNSFSHDLEYFDYVLDKKKL